MSDVEIQQPVCAKCGAEVRPDTAFCYNCGAAVTANAAPLTANGTGTVLNENSASKGENVSLRNESGSVKSESETGNMNGLSGRLEDRRPAPPKYESAAGLRRKSKAAVRKPVEVTWEPEGESLNITFVIATVCLAIIVAVLVAVALYLK